MTDPQPPMLFLAEVVSPENGRPKVRFRYVIDGRAELVIAREWWEQMGSPEEVEVSIQPVTGGQDH